MRIFVAIYGALSIACGAFGAHGLKKILSPESLAIWETAVKYHLISALFLLILELLPNKNVLSFRMMALGSLVFSGSLYALSLSSIKILGAITPIGGVLMIAAWISLIKQK